MVASHHLEFGATINSAIRSAQLSLKTPYTETKREVDQMTRCRDMAI